MTARNWRNWWIWRRTANRGSRCDTREGGHGQCWLGVELLEDRTVPNAPGTLDPTFGTSGTVSVSFSSSLPSEFLDAEVIQSDGKIIAAGSVNAGGNAGEFAVARFNTDGSLDTTFGTGGSTFTPITSLPSGYANGTNANGVGAAVRRQDHPGRLLHRRRRCEPHRPGAVQF